MKSWTVLRVTVTVVVAVLVLGSLGAGDVSARYYKDSHQLMCVCGCSELLGECNHVSCPDSGNMREQLISMISSGKSDSGIFHAFQKQYGPVVLAAPMFTPFNHLAWIIPPVVLFLGIGAALMFVRKWRLKTVPMPPPSDRPGMDEIRQRIRGETQL